jgi:translation initiation factor eIF-2B subunit epsilon
VPDTHLLHKEATFSHSRRFIYKDVQSTVSRSAVLGDGVVVGQDAVVGDGVDLKGTVVGARCIIRGGSVIADSHLFAGVVIEQDVKITHAIIAENVTVKKGAVISRGCVLSAGVIIGEGIILPEFTRVSLRRSIVTPAADVDDTFGGDIDVGVVGTDGVGLKWVYEGGDDYTLDKICDDDDGTGIDMIRASSMGCFEEECERARRWKVFPLPVDEESDGDESDEDGLDAPQASVDFDDVIGDMVASGLKSNDLAENILMEIKGFKFAQNKEFADCITASVPALLTHMSTMGINKIQLIGNCKTFFSVGGKGFTILNGLCQDEEDE